MPPPVVPKKATQAPAVGSIVDILSSRAAADLPAPPAPAKLTQRSKTKGPTEVHVTVLEQGMKEGRPMRSCADLMGISPRTLAAWLAIGTKDDAPDIYADLYAAALRGRAAMDGEVLEAMKVHLQTSPAFALHMVKARFPEYNNVASKTEVKTQAVPFEAEEAKGMSDEELEAEMEREHQKLLGA